MTSADVIRALRADGWRLKRVNGSHHIFGDHPTKAGIVVVPHPKKKLQVGLIKSIEAQAQLTLR
ncbi:MAG: type II toxin-antitoxin system HicA family toxin [Myxococcota bacterium]|nr:type II toxin-antitoxin system HicA family toxin [Myxococcota bacterium]